MVEIFLKDYQANMYEIDKVYLLVNLSEHVTTVTGILSVLSRNIQNINTNNSNFDLLLHGAGQEIVDIKIDDLVLSKNNYEIVDNKNLLIKKKNKGLGIENNRFTLEITVKIYPGKNTSLNGLYKSGSMFCTQCEAEGFRNIMYYLDRPDNMAIFTVKIEADKKKYPILLSNGNLIEQGDIDHQRHFTVWEDPFKKPSYLFALVAADLIAIEDKFITKSSKLVTLKIYIEHTNLEKSGYAMQALKKAMVWDENKYGREYDLDLYMIVAVNDFNMGAMENKGLNIFNAKYILADPATATDLDFELIDAVIGHEYFHNWSGNRITCRDWFQLSLKEGFTVFREQQFSQDMTKSITHRIDQINMLRSKQFAEDSSNIAHPVRPESYIEINNFYTMTIYEKGAELIRMMSVILGWDNFRKGTDLYFSRYDGQAVTTDDFIQALEDASGLDLQQFKLWYVTSGTPHVKVQEFYDKDSQQYKLTLSQESKAKSAMHIPIKIGLLGSDGAEILSEVLELTEMDQEFVFNDIKEHPIPSLLRDFSAPIRLTHELSDQKLLFLIKFDSNDFNKWDSAQQLYIRAIADFNKIDENNNYIKLLSELFTVVLQNSELDLSLKASILSLPSVDQLINQLQPVDPVEIYHRKAQVLSVLVNNHQEKIINLYQNLINYDRYEYRPDLVSNRTLKNLLLNYLVKYGKKENINLAIEQYNKSNNMTDSFSALRSIVNSDINNAIVKDFYKKWQHETLVINKWFQVQAQAEVENNLDLVKELMQSKSFDLKNPNNVYALIGGFTSNIINFHKKDGTGYKFIADLILKLDLINPQVAARILNPFTKLYSLDPLRTELIKTEIEKILTSKTLSKDVLEIAHKAI